MEEFEIYLQFDCAIIEHDEDNNCLTVINTDMPTGADMRLLLNMYDYFTNVKIRKERNSNVLRVKGHRLCGGMIDVENYYSEGRSMLPYGLFYQVYFSKGIVREDASDFQIKEILRRVFKMPENCLDEKKYRVLEEEANVKLYKKKIFSDDIYVAVGKLLVEEIKDTECIHSGNFTIKGA